MKYIDLHCDTLLELYRQKKGTLYSNPLCVDIEKMRAGDALLQAFACFVYLPEHDGLDGAWNYVMQLLDLYEKEAAGTDLKLCRNGSDLYVPERDVNACASGKMMQTERTGDSGSDEMYSILTVEEGGILDDSEERLDILYDRGVRLMTLTWNFENCLGFPNSADAAMMQMGLKPFGKKIVEKMNERKMIVDVSHLSDGGFYDVADIMKAYGRPFVASHSCARALCAHQRNLTDEMLKVLGNAGGVVGLNFFGLFLNKEGRSDIASMIAHLKYIVNKAGIEAAGLGSDFDGFGGGSEIENAAHMPRLFDAMAKAGFSASEIEMIAWKNAARVIKTSI